MKIELSEQTFRRLQQHSEPLVDTAESVIIKLLDRYETRKGLRQWRSRTICGAYRKRSGSW